MSLARRGQNRQLSERQSRCHKERRSDQELGIRSFGLHLTGREIRWETGKGKEEIEFSRGIDLEVTQQKVVVCPPIRRPVHRYRGNLQPCITCIERKNFSDLAIP